jgi:amino acid transporter
LTVVFGPQFVRNSTTLSQIAAGVMAVVATIVAPPPTSGYASLRAFASFVVAILAAIFLLVLRRLKKQEHALLWAATAALNVATAGDIDCKRWPASLLAYQ